MALRIAKHRAVASLSLPGGQDRMISSIFPHFPVASLIFLHFLPHFGLPGGRLAHPGRPWWLRHWPLPSGWPLITPGNHMAFLSNFTCGWPQMALARPLTPSMHYTLVWGSFYQFWQTQDNSEEFDLLLTLADTCMNFDPSNALHSGHGFFLPNLVAIGHC